LATKSGALSPYQIEVDLTELRIVTLTSSKVKSTIKLSDFHIKDAQKQPREDSASENDFSEKSLKQKRISSWYPLKMVLQ